MPDNKSLGEYTIAELLKMVGQGAVKGVKTAVDIMPLTILAKMIGGATATNPMTTPVKDVGKNMLIGMGMEEGEKSLRKIISKKQDENAQRDPIGLANIIGNIQNSDKEIDIQGIQDLIGSDSATENTSSANQSESNSLSASSPGSFLTSANQPTAVAESPSAGDFPNPGNMSAGTKSAGVSPADTGSTPAGKKGYGWPVALMMLGKGLQGGNPMDVLSELMANERLSKSQGFEMQKLGKTQEFDMQKLEAEYGYRLRNELLKPNTSGNEDAAAMNLFQQDLVGMIEAFEQIPMKGNKLAGATGALASPIWGREARAKYQTKARSFGYSYGAIVWGQQGRALDARENKILEEITNFRTTQTRGEILGKMQALIDATNSRARQQGLPELPDARILVSQIKNNKSQSVSNAPKVTGFKIKE